MHVVGVVLVVVVVVVVVVLVGVGVGLGLGLTGLGLGVVGRVPAVQLAAGALPLLGQDLTTSRECDSSPFLLICHSSLAVHPGYISANEASLCAHS